MIFVMENVNMMSFIHMKRDIKREQGVILHENTYQAFILSFIVRHFIVIWRFFMRPQSLLQYLFDLCLRIFSGLLWEHEEVYYKFIILEIIYLGIQMVQYKRLREVLYFSWIQSGIPHSDEHSSFDIRIIFKSATRKYMHQYIQSIIHLFFLNVKKMFLGIEYNEWAHEKEWHIMINYFINNSCMRFIRNCIILSHKINVIIKPIYINTP
jgi:hypothetical protein